MCLHVFAPGPVDTDLFRAGKDKTAIARSAAMSPFNRVGSPEEMAPLIAFLASYRASWRLDQIVQLTAGCSDHADTPSFPGFALRAEAPHDGDGAAGTTTVGVGVAIMPEKISGELSGSMRLPEKKKPDPMAGLLHRALVAMLRHAHELILRPGRDGMDVAVLITHEIEVSEGNGHRLGTDAEKSTDIDNGLASSACTVNVIHLADLMVIGTVNSRAF